MSDVRKAVELMRKFEQNGNQSEKGEAGETLTAALRLAHWALPLLDETTLAFEQAEELLADSPCGLLEMNGQLSVTLPEELEIKTHGQLRMLCRSFGLELKEPTNG